VEAVSDLDALARFNDEEWVNQPYTIELRGGRACGQRLASPELPSMWRVPELLGIDFLTASEPALSTESSSRVADYRRTDEVTDGGAHVYEFDRFE
jgi:hypothetical protein